MGSKQQQLQDSQQEFCLKWNDHQSNMFDLFDSLLVSESFVDVTLACDGHLVKAHKVVLSACSPYFRKLLEENPCGHPIVILADVRGDEMRAIVQFMYKGQVNVTREKLTALLKAARTLKIKGLNEVDGGTQSEIEEPDVAALDPSLSDTFSSSQHFEQRPQPQALTHTSYPASASSPRHATTTTTGTSNSQARRKRMRSIRSVSNVIKHIRYRASFDRGDVQPPEDVAYPPDGGQNGQQSPTLDYAETELPTVKQEAILYEEVGYECDREPDHGDDSTTRRPFSNGESSLDMETTMDRQIPDFLAPSDSKPLLLLPPPQRRPFDNGDVRCRRQRRRRSPVVRQEKRHSSVKDAGSNECSGHSSTNALEKKPPPSPSLPPLPLPLPVTPSTQVDAARRKKTSAKKKTSWTVTDLMSAIESVRSGRMNVLKAAMTFKIPKSSLYDYVNGRSGSRLRLMKRIQPHDAIRVFGGGGGNGGAPASPLQFLAPKSAATILTAHHASSLSSCEMTTTAAATTTTTTMNSDEARAAILDNEYLVQQQRLLSLTADYLSREDSVKEANQTCDDFPDANSDVDDEQQDQQQQEQDDNRAKDEQKIGLELPPGIDAMDVCTAVISGSPSLP